MRAGRADPCLPQVGYESEAAAAQLTACGFRPAGSLRGWLRDTAHAAP